MLAVRAITVCLALVTGCASAPRPTTFRAAERAYWAAEERMRDEQWPEAIALFRRAAIALPDTTTYREARHDLVMRIAHTQLRAHSQTGDVGYLADAAQMLARYAAHAGNDASGEQRRELTKMSRMVEHFLDDARREGQRVASDPRTRYPDVDRVEVMIAAADVPTAAERKGVRPSTSRPPGPLPVNTYAGQYRGGSDAFRAYLMERGSRR